MNVRNAQLEQDMRNVVSEVEDLLTTVGSEGSAASREVKERAARAISAAKERLASIDGQVRTTARHAVEATDDYVHDRPWNAVLGGALVGLLVGLLVARR